eukprot:536967-Amphidinium_carterae.1
MLIRMGIRCASCLLCISGLRGTCASKACYLIAICRALACVIDNAMNRLERCRSLSMENIRAVAISPYFGVSERKSFQFAALKADVSFNVWTFGASLKERAGTLANNI